MNIWKLLNQTKLKRNTKNILFIFTNSLFGTFLFGIISFLLLKEISIQTYLLIIFSGTVLFEFGSIFYLMNHDFKN